MATVYAELGEESWGDRLRRARNSKDIGLKEAAARLTRLFTPVSMNTLQRLEYMSNPPSGARRLTMAAAYVASLGFDPRDFEIDLAQLPDMYDERFFRRIASASPSSA